MLTKDTPLTPTMIVGLKRMYGWLNSGRFLGIARRPPVMQNGQAPGVPRQYDHTYALLMMETLGRGYKPGTMRAVMRTQAKGGEL